MNLQRCSRCKKRPAMVFITRLDNGKTINEGLCLICAKELGIQPVNDMLRKMGVEDEDMDAVLSDIENGLPEFFEADDDLSDGNVPTLNIGELFGMGGEQPKGKKRGRKGTKKGSPDEMDESKKNLSTYCTNLNEKARSGKIDSLIGRDREIDRIIQILCRRQKNNPCLIGEPGVGKTAIAEELAKRIVEGRVPEALADVEIWQLDLTSLVAGTQFRGQFESRILALLKEIKAAGNIILMIDEVHNLAGAGETSDGSMSAGNILKPALSRGEIRVIGATTLKEYRKHIEKDSALERRFQPVKVEEPSVDDTVEIIRGIKKYYEAFHGLVISDEVARAAAILSEKYITDRFLPDKAIDLIDEAASRVALDSPELNEYKRLTKSYEEIVASIEALETKMENPEGQTEQNFGKLASLKSERMRIENRLEELKGFIDGLTVKVSDLLKVIEIWTGIPASELSVGDLENLTGLHERLSKHIIGQDAAVSAVVRAVKRKRAGVSYRTNPVSMIFAGPTGVGKTELVRVLAKDLFKQPESLIRLDMSEFMEKHSVSRIIGSPPGYVGYDEAGQLTEKIRRRPYSVILFDEIEKAHPDAAWAGKNLICQLSTQEHLGDLVGLCGQIQIRKSLRIDRLGDEPSIDQCNLIVGVVCIVCHFQVNFTILPCFAGVEQGIILSVQRLYIFYCRCIHDHNIHFCTQFYKFFFLNGTDSLNAQILDHILYASYLEGNVILGSHQMVGCAPVAQTTNVHTGLICLRNVGNSSFDGSLFVGNKLYKLVSLFLLRKHLA